MKYIHMYLHIPLSFVYNEIEIIIVMCNFMFPQENIKK